MFKLKSFSLGLGAVVAALSVGLPSAAERNAMATVVAAKGAVLIGTQASVVPAGRDMALHEADRVYVLDDSSATLTFADGCRQDLSANTILTVLDTGTCQDVTVSLTDAVQAFEQCATGQLGAGEVLGPSCGAAAAAAPGRVVALFPAYPEFGSAALWAAGSLAAMGVIYAVTDDDDSGPPLTPQRPPLSPE